MPCYSPTTSSSDTDTLSTSHRNSMSNVMAECNVLRTEKSMLEQRLEHTRSLLEQTVADYRKQLQVSAHFYDHRGYQFFAFYVKHVIFDLIGPCTTPSSSCRRRHALVGW